MQAKPSRLIYDGPAQVRANSLFRVTLRVTPGVDVVPGGRLVVGVRHVSDFGDPQMTAPDAENYITVRGGDDAHWRLGEICDWPRLPWNQGIDLRLKSGRVAAGETVTITLGDPAGGCPGYRCQSFTETHFRLRLGIDPDGSGSWDITPGGEAPGFAIVGAATSGVRVVVSDCTGRTGPRTVHVKPEEAFRKRLRDVAGFAHVPRPVAMRNTQNAIVYYLFFASQKPVARKIVEHIFRKWAEWSDKNG